MRKTVAPISYRSLSKASAVLVATLLLLSACVATPPPYEDYTLARAAIKAAQDVDSARFSGGYWNRASDDFRDGEKAWKDGEFENAKKLFKSTIQLAERAENATRLKRFQTGDGLP
jgi:hypothetical protein